jgi:hypothetical protein
MSPRIGRALGWAAALAIGAGITLRFGLAHGQGNLAAFERVLGSELGAPQTAAAPEPKRHDPRRLEGVPDLMQTDPELGVPGGGDSHCGPVAASNALAWLAGHGLPELLPDGASDKERQIRLVRAIAGKSFMSTSEYNGTGSSGVLKGIDLYVRAQGYRPARLQYQGWRAHQLRYSTGVRTPEIAFLEQGLLDGGVALVNVGWYRPGQKPGVYRRKGGHWLTVVGAGLDERGRADPDALVLHDPAPWSGEAPKAHHVRAEPLGEGWLFGEEGPFPSKGFRVIRGDLAVKRPGEVAIIDGAVVLVPKRGDAVASAP